MSQTITIQPNSQAAIRERVAAGKVTWGKVLFMLASRLVLFAFFQAMIAGILGMLGSPAPWESSIAWWPFSATLTSLVSIGLLVGLARREGMGYVDYLNFNRQTVGRDLLLILGFMLIAGPVGFLPNTLLAGALFGDPMRPVDMFINPLPAWAAWLAVFFPLTIAFAELPTYFGYAMPRLGVLTGRTWVAVLVAGFFLSLQHITLPLIFDGAFLLWRGLMFLPFALFLGLILSWRPRLMVYLMVIHAILDLQLVLMVWAESLG